LTGGFYWWLFASTFTEDCKTAQIAVVQAVVSVMSFEAARHPVAALSFFLARLFKSPWHSTLNSAKHAGSRPLGVPIFSRRPLEPERRRTMWQDSRRAGLVRQQTLLHEQNYPTITAYWRAA
jgi:hypothetical protein